MCSRYNLTSPAEAVRDYFRLQSVETFPPRYNIAPTQPVLVVRHCSEHGAPSDLMRAAYHLGNRHVAVELKPDHLKLEPDHVLAQLLRRMHLIVSEESTAFEPEAGAYEGGGHEHEHGHEHGHDHGHEPHAHEHHGHEHHDHGRDHDHSHHDHGHEEHHGHGQPHHHDKPAR